MKQEAKLTVSYHTEGDARWHDRKAPGGTFRSLDTGGTTAKRVFAYLIDALFLGMLVPAAWILGVMTLGLLTPVLSLLLFLAPFIYHPLCIASERGATIGQRFMGLRVVTHEGGSVNPVQALFQTILFYATLGFSGGLLLLWALFDDKSRCLHDIFSGTVIVHDE